MYIVNPSGKIKGVENKILLEQLLNTHGFRKATQEEVAVFRSEQLKEKSINNQKNEIDKNEILLATVASGPDGYGQSKELLYDALQKAGVKVSLKNNNQTISLIYSYPDRIKEIKSKVKIIYTMFESTSIPSNWIKYLKKADLVLVPSKFCQKAFLTKGIKTEVVPLGYDTTAYNYKQKEQHKEFTFLHYNSFNTRKGWDIVFKAFTEEFKIDEPVKLIMKTVKQNLPFPIIKSEYPNIEVIKKEMSRTNLANLIHSSDCFVFPSRGEGFGLTPLEALATGTPVIIPNGSGMSEYFNSEYFYKIDIECMKPAMYAKFDSKDTGEMIEPSKDSLKKQMRYVYENRQKAIDKAKKGAEWVKKNYSIDNTGVQLALHLKKFEGSKNDAIKKVKQNSNTLNIIEV